MPHDSGDVVAICLTPGTVTIAGLDPVIWEDAIHQLNELAKLNRLAGLRPAADALQQTIDALTWHVVTQ